METETKCIHSWPRAVAEDTQVATCAYLSIITKLTIILSKQYLYENKYT